MLSVLSNIKAMDITLMPMLNLQIKLKATLTTAEIRDHMIDVLGLAELTNQNV